MRNTMMNALRKAGTALNEFDKAYAYKLQEGVKNTSIPLYMRAAPLEQFNKPVFPMSAYESVGGIGPRTVQEAQIGGIVDKVLLGTNIASRYALPAGGITLAGKGLFDLTQGLYEAASNTPVFGGPEDGAQPGQLPMY